MTSTTITPRVRERIGAVHTYIAHMEHERQGWGTEAAGQVARTRASFLDGLRIMVVESTDVWCDGPGMSFGGVLPGGITYGMIARTKPNTVEGGDFDNPEVEWTFHS